MTKQVPVIAAIPNYNMADGLRRLLPQVLAQRYDRIFVLDDASTDDSAVVVSEFAGDVKFVRSSGNRGAGANRNQIIDHVEDGLIHFIDADMDLGTGEIPAVARETVARYADRGVGLIGGLVSRLDGSQEPHNYGPAFSLRASFTSGLPLAIDRVRQRPQLAAAVQRVVAPMMNDWPNVLVSPRPTPAYWVHEGNMLIDAGLFKSIGGYNPIMRSHEAQDLAIRLEKIGVKRQFDPCISVLHHHIDVRGRNRNKWANKAALYLIRKHGLLRWLTD